MSNELNTSRYFLELELLLVPHVILEGVGSQKLRILPLPNPRFLCLQFFLDSWSHPAVFNCMKVALLMTPSIGLGFNTRMVCIIEENDTPHTQSCPFATLVASRGSQGCK